MAFVLGFFLFFCNQTLSFVVVLIYTIIFIIPLCRCIETDIYLRTKDINHYYRAACYIDKEDTYKKYYWYEHENKNRAIVKSHHHHAILLKVN